VQEDLVLTPIPPESLEDFADLLGLAGEVDRRCAITPGQTLLLFEEDLHGRELRSASSRRRTTLSKYSTLASKPIKQPWGIHPSRATLDDHQAPGILSGPNKPRSSRKTFRPAPILPGHLAFGKLLTAAAHPPDWRGWPGALGQRGIEILKRSTHIRTSARWLRQTARPALARL
jgi:hypothetical protein